MKQTLIFTAMIFVSSLSFAGGFGVGNGGDGLDMSYGGSQPVNTPVNAPAGVVNFSDLKNTWQAKGVSLNEQVLNGTWKMVAYATAVNCNWGLADGYNAKGFKMPDGQVLKLQFQTTDTGSNDFTGAPAKSVFTVTLFNLGNKDANQGPYQVNPLQPQFSQWSYTTADVPVMRGDSYYEYSCRGISGVSNKMLCALKLRLLQPEKATAKSTACASNEFSAMYGFVKE